ncbi:hypothetical protein AFCDBAGC_2188 [Methylobacterium cerastii]|uniref:Heme exporter protein D n=1 Tax=Methylobacterium cerastii TaxID=932741 RepID=A0ABQ4QGW5_9HYPH|nr:hypothetical protein [Methylobacterium cerastii]GJD44321.1 hypothetical protein AFCDBAGC_2188 [Methylobacterium cerastii]
MTDPLFAVFDIGLVFALGLAIWQLVSLRRGMRRDRAAEATRTDREE